MRLELIDYNTVVGYASPNGKQIGVIRWANGTLTKVKYRINQN
jgi:hypothetical protein